MITCVCLKPCIDRYCYVQSLNVGQYNAVTKTRSDISGKGVNVAVALNRLGCNTQLLGLNFSGNGALLNSLLDDENVPYGFIMCNGNIRTNIKLIEDGGRLTEINESGEVATPETVSAFTELYRQKAAGSSFVCISGSLPAGFGDDYYKRLVALADGKAVLDCSGITFTKGIEAHPYLVKPNDYELSLFLGKPVNTVKDAVLGAVQLQQKGIALVCVSLGKMGAVLTDGIRAYYSPIIDVPVASTVGAGDAMISGIISVLQNGGTLSDAFASGTAASTAAVQMQGTEPWTKQAYQHFLQHAVVKEININEL